jgi:hypothetical protein
MGKLLQLLGVPEWAAWLGLTLAGMAALAVAVVAFGQHERQVGADEVQARWDGEKAERWRVVARAQAQARGAEQQQARKAQEVDQHVEVKLAAVAADRDRVVRQLGGLRDELAAVRAGAVPGGPADTGEAAQTRALADSLGECSERYSAVAGERDELAVQVGGLIALLPAE